MPSRQASAIERATRQPPFKFRDHLDGTRPARYDGGPHCAEPGVLRRPSNTDPAPERDARQVHTRAAAAAVSVAQIRDGDHAAFELLFAAYYEPLYYFVYPYVRSRDVAEEVAQEVFCRLWERRASLQPRDASGGAESLRAFLYRSARNAAVSWLRHQRVEQRLYTQAPSDAEPPGMGTRGAPVDAGVQSEELRLALRRAIASLPDPYRQVLTLRSQHHLSYAEIATVLEIPLKTVESRVTRAFRALRERLAQHR